MSGIPASKGKRVMAVASGGGHWVQMLRLAPALEGHVVTFVTTMESYRGQIPAGAKFRTVCDGNMNDKWGLVKMGLALAWLVATERPDVLISTGAAPGYIALRLAKLLGASTIWVDSMANAEELSMAGRKVEKHADLWLTQWPHLARTGGPYYAGGVI